MKRYITDRPYIVGQYNCCWSRSSRDGLGIKLNNLDLSTHVALLTFSRIAVLQKRCLVGGGTQSQFCTSVLTDNRLNMKQYYVYSLCLGSCQQ